MDLEVLKAQAADLVANMEILLEVASEEDRDLTKDEDDEYQGLEANLTTLESQIKRAEKMEERRNNLSVLARTSGTGVQQTAGKNIQGNSLPVSSSVVVGDAQEDPQAGFSSLAEFAQAVYRANPQNPGMMVDPRLAGSASDPSGYHQESGGGTEGFLVPPKFKDNIWELVVAEEGLINATDHEPTDKNQVEFLADEDTPWATGGISARWRTEGSKMDPQKFETDSRSLKLSELYCFVVATDELLEDASRLNARLTKKTASAINWKIDESILYGTGVGQPLGFMNSGALITVPADTGQEADTISVTNISTMYSRMLSSSVRRAVWLANTDIIPGLTGLKIGDQPVWVPPREGIKAAPGGHLMGRPVRFTEHAKTLGDRGDLLFVDLKGYYTARRNQTPNFASSIHLYFDYGLQAFRWTIRMGGQPYLSAPVARAHGANTQSSFVALAERV